MANRTVSVQLTANVAAYIAGMQSAVQATVQLTAAQEAAKQAQAQATAVARAQAQAQKTAAAQAVAAARAQATALEAQAAAQRTLGAAMARDISRQTQLANQHSQALEENARRDEEAGRKRADSQKKVGQAALIGGAILAAGALVSVQKAAQFEQAMSHVNAVTDETATTMGRLKQAALDAGAKTVFTATESANAIEELAKAGLSSKDILGGGLSGALALAAAGSLGVADAAEISASALVQFNLAGNQATHVADLLSAGANKAQGSVQDLGLGLSYVGPVAANLGVSIDQTTGALALLANNGILAERGGTALRGMLLSLTSPSKKAQEELDSLGISMYDAQGKFIGIDGAAQALKAGLGPLTEAQRNYALGVIFSNAQVTSANVLIKGGAQAVQDWTGKVNDQGNAARTAATKLDNLKGDVEKLGGAFDTAFITTGQGGLDPFRTVTQGITGVVNAYNGIPAAGKTATFITVGVAGAAGLAGGAFLLLGPRIVATRAAMATLAPAGSRAASALGTLRKVAGGLAILTTVAVGIGALANAGERAAPGIETTTNALLRLHSAGDAAALDQVFDGKEIDSFTGALQKLADPSLHDKIQNVGQKIVTLGTSHGQAATVEARKDIEALDQSLASLVQSGNTEQAATAFEVLSAKASDAGVPVDKLKSLLPGYADALKGVDNQATLAAGSTSALAGVTTDLGNAEEDTRSAAERLKDAIAGLNGGATDTARAQIALRDGLEGVKTQFKGAADSTSLSTTKGRENLGVVLDQIDKTNDYAQAVADQASASTDQATAVNKGRKAFQDQIGALRGTLLAAGLTKKQVDGLITTYGKVPTKAQTDVEVYGVDKATGKVNALEHTMKNFPARVSSTLAAKDSATPILDNVLSRLRQLPDHKTVSIIGKYLTVGTVPPLLRPSAHADGGHIVGPGGPRDDAIPALLSNGEFVVNAAATSRNRALLESINARKFADGGFAQLAGRNPLNGISSDLQAQVTIVSNVKSTAADVAKAAAEVERLQKAWKDTADAIDQARARRELLLAIDVADRKARAAAKTKDKADDKEAASGQADARKSLRTFDADAKRAAQSDLNDRRAASAAALAATAATVDANRKSAEFDALPDDAARLKDIDGRIKGERKYTDEWVRLTEQRAGIQATIDAAAKQAADDAAAAAKQAADDAVKAAQVKADYLFDQMSPAEQLADVNRRIAGETQYTEAWVALANQRDQLQKSIDSDAKQALDTQKQAVEAQAQTLNGLLDQQASLTAQLTAAQATYDKAVAGIRQARTDVLATFDPAQRQSVTPGASISNLLKNASAGNANFEEWTTALATARRNGVSEAVIRSLGLDQGPQALGQLRQLNKASAAQVTDFNALTDRRAALAATQTGAEAGSGVGQVAADIKAALGELTTSQADINGQLGQLGVDQGRTYAGAIAQGLASGQAAVRAAALALIGGAGAYDVLAGRGAGTTQSAGFASGGPVYGPGSGTSDSVPAWLSNGEYVVHAAATAAHRPLLDAINAGRYADGGYVSAVRAQGSRAAVGTSPEVNTWALQMEVRRLREALDYQTGVIQEGGALRPLPSNAGW